MKDRTAVRASLVLALSMLLLSSIVLAVPPPVPRAPIAVELARGGEERFVDGEARPYQPVEVTFRAAAGDALLLQVVDADRVLVLAVRAPSNARWIEGAQAGPDGLRLSLGESGEYRVAVAVSADAARAAASRAFRLRLRLLR